MASPRQWRDRLKTHPHLEDGSAYRQLRPTKLDKIKNFHVEVQADTVNEGLTLEASSNRCPRVRPSRDEAPGKGQLREGIVQGLS